MELIASIARQSQRSYDFRDSHQGQVGNSLQLHIEQFPQVRHERPASEYTHLDMNINIMCVVMISV